MWLVSPTLEAGAAFLGEHAPKLALSGRVLVAIGRCRVTYVGRAESRIGSGDRIILAKPDGTLLIHDPTGLKPVNWQPPGCTFQAVAGAPVLVATRRRPAETVRIEFERLDAVGAHLLEAGTPLELRGTEFDIRDTLRAHPELVEPGFVPWERERVTERGPLDLYGEDSQGRRVVVEVKRVPAGLAEATQLWRYVEAERTKREVVVRGILVAPRVTPRARALLQEHDLEFREVSLETLQRGQVPLARPGKGSLLSFVPKP